MCVHNVFFFSGNISTAKCNLICYISGCIFVEFVWQVSSALLAGDGQLRFSTNKLRICWHNRMALIILVASRTRYSRALPALPILESQWGCCFPFPPLPLENAIFSPSSFHWAGEISWVTVFHLTSYRYSLWPGMGMKSCPHPQLHITQKYILQNVDLQQTSTMFVDSHHQQKVLSTKQIMFPLFLL